LALFHRAALDRDRAQLVGLSAARSHAGLLLTEQTFRGERSERQEASGALRNSWWALRRRMPAFVKINRTPVCGSKADEVELGQGHLRADARRGREVPRPRAAAPALLRPA